jgi:hypothetical protein
MMLTASFENWIVKLSHACLDGGHRQINFNASTVVQCTSINRSARDKKAMRLHVSEMWSPRRETRNLLVKWLVQVRREDPLCSFFGLRTGEKGFAEVAQVKEDGVLTARNGFFANLNICGQIKEAK